MNSRTFPFSIKAIDEAGVINGVISAFGGVDSYGDSIAPGAYAKTLREIAKSGRKLPLLYQHDAHRPIGVWTDLVETSEGLMGNAELALEVRDAAEAYALARKGALTGISIGYSIPEGGSRRNGNVRVLTEVTLHEASLVTFPADNAARVTSVKSIQSAGDIADLLREVGISGRKAKAAAGAAWRAINETENDDAARAVLTNALGRLKNL